MILTEEKIQFIAVLIVLGLVYVVSLFGVDAFKFLTIIATVVAIRSAVTTAILKAVVMSSGIIDATISNLKKRKEQDERFDN